MAERAAIDDQTDERIEAFEREASSAREAVEADPAIDTAEVGDHQEGRVDQPGQAVDGVDPASGLAGADLLPDDGGLQGAPTIGDDVDAEESAGNGRLGPDIDRTQDVGWTHEEPERFGGAEAGNFAGPAVPDIFSALDPDATVDAREAEITDLMGGYDPVTAGLDVMDPPADATHPGFDDITATTGDGFAGTVIGFLSGTNYEEGNGFSRKPETQQWKEKMQEILGDKTMDQEKKEKAMTELAEKVQKAVEEKKKKEEEGGDEPDPGSGGTDPDGASGSDDSDDDSDSDAVETEAPEPDEPSGEDYSPDGIDPSQIKVDFSDTEWQIKMSAEANDDIQYADHPGSEPAFGTGAVYDGVDYGEDFSEPDDIPADAVGSVYDDPAIDPTDEPMEVAEAFVGDGMDLAEEAMVATDGDDALVEATE